VNKQREINSANLINRIKKVSGAICSIGVYVFLFFFIVCYSFYAPEGYTMIATNKYRFFKRMCVITAEVMAPFILFYYTASLAERGKTLSEKYREFAGSISLTDIFVLLFVLANCISFFFTDFPEEALWGTDGWYMGFAMQLIFAGIYFFMSRFYDGRINVLYFFMAVTGVVFLWGLLNRFSVYPVKMENSSPSFLSSMGNINWLCGFWSVFFSIGIALYLTAQKRWERIFCVVHMMISLAFGVVEGSDSAYLSMAVVFFFFLMVSFRKADYMKRFLETGILFCTACQILRFISVCRPKSLNFQTPLMDLMLGNLTLIVLGILILLRFILYRKVKEEWNPNFKWLRNIAAGAAAVIFFFYMALLVLNTNNPGSIGQLSDYPTVFLFDGSWGSKRGMTWRDGIDIFKSMPPVKKLIGVGPDCFAAYAYSIPEITQRLNAEWGESRLTNAHNECITFLVNLGITGLAAFIGIFAAGFIRLLKKAVKEPMCYVFAASLLSYFFHNQFSFSQVLNIPFLFMMLGLGENLMQKEWGRRDLREPDAQGNSGPDR